MRHVLGPAFIASTRPTDPAVHTRTWGGDALMHEPPLLFQHTIDRLPIDDDPIPAAQQHPQSPIPKGGVLLNALAQPLRPRWLSRPPAPRRPVDAMRAGAATPSTSQPLRSETPGSVPITRQRSSGQKGRTSTPPTRYRCRGRDPLSSVSSSLPAHPSRPLRLVDSCGARSLRRADASLAGLLSRRPSAHTSDPIRQLRSHPSADSPRTPHVAWPPTVQSARERLLPSYQLIGPLRTMSQE